MSDVNIKILSARVVSAAVLIKASRNSGVVEVLDD